MAKDLTQLQIRSLPEVFNFTDGHAHRSFTPEERPIAEGLSDIFFEVEREKYSEIKRTYLEAFYSLYSQTFDTTATKYLLLPSASISLEIVANFLRVRGLDLVLIEPCFDNLTNMFKRHNVGLEAFQDFWFETGEFLDRLRETHGQAICLVSPNNPTGITCSPEQFRQLVDFCKQEHRLLIIDSSFRAYKQEADQHDEYRLLQESGIEYIMIEDTGKTWPTKELKVSALAMAPSLYKTVYDIYTDFLYHHSPVTIRLLTELIRFSKADNLRTVKDNIAVNRAALHKAVEGTFLVPQERAFTSVTWLRIQNDLGGEQLAGILKEAGIFILPGTKFFWSGHSTGGQYLRIALARDPEVFARAMERLSGILELLHAREHYSSPAAAGFEGVSDASEAALAAPGSSASSQ
jgi:aspartate/methionine/tyrosine aminotransferase